MKTQTYAERCLERAVASGHYTWVQDDGSIKVASDSEPGVARRVTFESNGSFIHFHCTCPAGYHHREELVCCKHAALAGKRLVREGLAIQTEGGIFCVPPEQQKLIQYDLPADPFHGLPTS